MLLALFAVLLKIKIISEQLNRHKSLRSETVNGTKMTKIAILAIFILGFAAYGNSLAGKFMWDDELLIKDNLFIRNTSYLAEIFTSDIGRGSGFKSDFYRPLQILSYLADYSLYKLKVFWGYHLTNILLHILAALILFWFLNLLCHDRLLSLFASILFVIHPVHSEAVAYISGRADILALILILLCFIFYLKEAQTKNIAFYILLLTSYSAALLSKETSLILPFLLLIYHYSFKNKINLPSFISIVTLTSLYGTIRFTAFRDFLPYASGEESISIFSRLPGFFVAIFNYLKILILPVNLHMEYGQILFKFTNPKAILGIIIIIMLLIYAFKKRNTNSLIFFSIAWFFTALLPVSNLYPLNAYMAEHWLYLPSVGFFLLLGEYLSNGIKKSRVFTVAVLSALVVFYLYLAVKQNSYWKDPVYFYERTIKFCPDSSKVNNNLGRIYSELDRTQDAIALFKRAISIDGNIDAYYNLATLYARHGEMDRAMSFYQKIIELSKTKSAKLYYNKIGLAYKNMGMMEEAIASFKKAVEANPYDLGAYNNLGAACGNIGNKACALGAFKRALIIAPGSADAHFNIAVFYYKNGQPTQAAEHFKKAIRLGYRVPDEYIKTLGLNQK